MCGWACVSVTSAPKTETTLCVFSREALNTGSWVLIKPPEPWQGGQAASLGA